MVYYTLAAVVSSTLYFVVFIPSNVGIRKAQRSIHEDARRLGRRSSPGFPPLAPTRVQVSFEPGPGPLQVRVSRRVTAGLQQVRVSRRITAGRSESDDDE